MLGYLFDEIYPRLPRGFELDVVSGTSVGAVHASYVATTAGQTGASRAARLNETWSEMELADMLQLSTRDLLGLPLRALGVTRLRRDAGGSGRHRLVGGLADFSALERIVAERIAWSALPANLARGRPGALCVSCTEVRSGRATVFMDGPLADPTPWSYDPGSQAVRVELAAAHVRASAAIPFLFPAVQVGDRFYVDGGMRMNTPLAPALRLGAERVLVIALKRVPGSSAGLPAYAEDVITQPAFLLGKVLDALTLDPLEYELARIDIVNSWIAHGRRTYGGDFLERINVAVESERGVGYRPVAHLALRPSQELGRVAADCYQANRGRSLGRLASLITRFALHGAPEGEADLLSYLYFDRSFTRRLLEMGRADAAAAHDRILALLTDPTPGG